MLKNEDLERFVRDYWTKKAFEGEVTEADFAALREEFAGFDVRGILERQPRDTYVWFKNQEGPQEIGVSPADAIKFFNAGMSIFLEDVRSPTIERWGRALSEKLGRAPGKFSASMFITKRGWQTKCHFDHIENFTVQLRGTKVWQFTENTQVPFTTVNYGDWIGHEQRAEMRLYASGKLLNEMPETASTITLRPGKMVYLPRGYWHEVDSERESISLLLAFPACPWTNFVLPALKTILLRHPEWRENLVFPNGDPGTWDRARTVIARLLRHLESTLREIEPGDLLPPRQRLAAADTSKITFRRNPLCSIVRSPAGSERMELVASVIQGDFSRRREVKFPTAALEVLDTIESLPRFSLVELELRHPHLAHELPKILTVLVELEMVLPSSSVEHIPKHDG